MTAPNLKGQIALVTGAGKGIGRACAVELAKAGATVIAIARTKEDLDGLAKEAGPGVGAFEPWIADVRDQRTIDRIRALPRIDILVNNAGTNKLQHILDVDDETLDLLIGLNIRAAFKVAQAVAAVMIQQGGGGNIVHVSSVAGHVGSKTRSLYAMTKHAVEGLTKAMAVELAEHRIRVNAVAPTVVRTPMTAPFFKDPAYEKRAMDTIPLKQVCDPIDIAEAVLYLVSPGARMVTGLSLKIDGGSTAQ
jgi:NAD(P)-dependent dehydrogenase (short-subunit alcohol dehydrogenase family)